MLEQDASRVWFQVRTTTPTTTTLTRNGVWNDGNWHNIVAVKTSSQLILYVDGVASSINLYEDGKFGTNNHSLIIGDRYNRYFNGTIDDVRVYNRALSSNEVTALYNQPDPVS